MPKVKVDEKKCIGCGSCVEVCPQSVFKMVNGKAKVVNEKACVGCRACEASCPVDAIKVTDD